jgi:ribosomal protein L11 methyltransferase
MPPTTGDARGGGGFVRFRVTSREMPLLEVALAEAWEAGAAGAVEEAGGLVVYASSHDAGRVGAALAALASRALSISGPEPEPRVAWAEAWKRGLGPVVISPRLLVRPPFAPGPADFKGATLEIEPGQAFGTGHHASTRLALLGLSELPESALRGAQFLDLGCGSGVLALAALALGAARAVGCDLDPLAPPAAVHAAHVNGFAAAARFFTGSTAAIGSGAFDGIAANLLRSELLPLMGELGRIARPRAWLVLAGLLTTEEPEVETALAAQGFRVAARASERDAGGDAWLGLTAWR